MASTEAAGVLQAYLQERPEIDSVRLSDTLKVSPECWVFTAQLDGRKVVVKRFLTGDPAATVTRLKDELDYLETVFGSGPYQANRCLLAWPEDGTAVLSFAPGRRLGDELARTSGIRRRRLLRQAGQWLARYTAPRRREGRFAPRYWTGRLEKLDRSAVTDAADRALLERLLDALRDRARLIRGCPVVQAATHGDFVGINLHLHQEVICGVDIQGESWMALAREAARFLVWLQVHDPDRPPERVHGIAAADRAAFLDSGLLEAEEAGTTLPFFLGTQFYERFLELYDRPDIRENARAAIEAYLSPPG